MDVEEVMLDTRSCLEGLLAGQVLSSILQYFPSDKIKLLKLIVAVRFPFRRFSVACAWRHSLSRHAHGLSMQTYLPLYFERLQVPRFQFIAAGIVLYAAWERCGIPLTAADCEAAVYALHNGAISLHLFSKRIQRVTRMLRRIRADEVNADCEAGTQHQLDIGYKQTEGWLTRVCSELDLSPQLFSVRSHLLGSLETAAVVPAGYPWTRRYLCADGH